MCRFKSVKKPRLWEEVEGVRFYEELVAQAKDEETREILLMIADEERKHLNIVLLYVAPLLGRDRRK